MRNWLIGALAAAVVATTLVPLDADARRLGGGRSSGMQRDMPARTAPDAVPAKPAGPTQNATPAQQAQQPGAAAAATGAAAQSTRSRWMAPIAGLAAGLGLAALMSYLGLGEAFANFLMLALLVVAVIALVAFLRRRFGKGAAAGGIGRTPALAGAGAASSPSSFERTSWQGTPATSGSAGGSGADGASATPRVETAAATAAVAPAAVTAAFVPATFDSEGFERIAKAIFVRMQAANDRADLDDLRRFTTPEMFAELKVDLLERGSVAQTTEVQRVDAKVLDVADDGERQVVSVRYQGEVLESAGAAPAAFDEVWHLVKPSRADGAWAIAGIEQMA